MNEHNFVIREQEKILSSKTVTLEEKNEAFRHIYTNQLLLAKRDLINVIVQLEKAEHAERSIAGQLKGVHTVINKDKLLKNRSQLRRDISQLDDQFKFLKDRVSHLDKLSGPKPFLW
jgi:hypothetical protein